jgi:hypothetical protein
MHFATNQTIEKLEEHRLRIKKIPQAYLGEMWRPLAETLQSYYGSLETIDLKR